MISNELILAADAAANPLLPNPWEILVTAAGFAVLLFLVVTYIAPAFEKSYQDRVTAIEGGLEKAEAAQAEATDREGLAIGDHSCQRGLGVGVELALRTADTRRRGTGLNHGTTPCTRWRQSTVQLPPDRSVPLATGTAKEGAADSCDQQDGRARERIALQISDVLRCRRQAGPQCPVKTATSTLRSHACCRRRDLPTPASGRHTS